MSSEARQCNEACEVYSRIVGYYSPVKNWNRGKREEFSARRTFKVNEQKKDGTNNNHNEGK